MKLGDEVAIMRGEPLPALSRGHRHAGTLARVAQPKRVRLQVEHLFTGTRHRPAVAASKQRVVVPAEGDMRDLSDAILTTVADAEPSTAFSCNQAELEQIRDAVTPLTEASG